MSADDWEEFARATPAQQAYATSARAAGGPSGAPGSPTNPAYLTSDPNRTAGPGMSVVNQQGQLQVPQGAGDGWNEFRPISPAEGLGRSLVTGLEKGAAGMVDAVDGAASFLTGGGARLGAMANNALGGPHMDPNAEAAAASASNPIAQLIPGITPHTAKDFVGQGSAAIGLPYRDPQNSAEGYAQTLGEFAGGAALPGSTWARAARVALPALASETAGEMTHGMGPQAEGISRTLGGLVGGGVTGMGEGMLAAPKAAIGATLSGVTEDQMMAAQLLRQQAAQRGINLSVSDAVQQVAGPSTAGLGRMQRVLEGTREGQGHFSGFYGDTAAKARGAVNDFADTVAPAGVSPSSVGTRGQAAATSAFQQADDSRYAALASALQDAGKADAAPVLSRVDAGLASAAAKDPQVSSPLTQARAGLFNDDAGMSPQARQAYEAGMMQPMGSAALAPSTGAMAETRSRLGAEFDRIASSTAVPLHEGLGESLQSIMDGARQVLPSSELQPLQAQVQNVAEVAGRNQGVIPGDAYQALTRRGAPLDRARASSDPNVSHYASLMRDALDDALHEAASPENAAALTQARLQYRSMKTVQDALNKTQPGAMVEPSALLSSVRKSYPNYAFEGGGSLGQAAEAGLKAQATPASLVSDPSKLLAVREVLSKAMDTPAPGDPTHAQVGGSVQALDSAIGAAAPNYGTTRAGQEAFDQQFVAPLKAGPLGRMAGSADLTGQHDALFPSRAYEGTARDTETAMHVLGQQDPALPADSIRAHLMAQFDQAARNNVAGAPPTSGAKFVASTVGTPEQAATLDTALRTLPQGDAKADDFAGLVQALQATGKRQAQGSATAFNQADLRDMGSSPGVRALESIDIARPFEFIGEGLKAANYRRNLNALSQQLTVHPDLTMGTLQAAQAATPQDLMMARLLASGAGGSNGRR